MLKEVQEVRVGGRTRRVYVRPFAMPAPLQVGSSGWWKGSL
jgi:hypothetical protein